MLTTIILAGIAPLPVSYTETNNIFRVGQLNFSCSLPNSSSCLSTIQNTINFYSPLIYTTGSPKVEKRDKALTTLDITMRTTQLPFDFHQSNETYRINVTSSGIAVEVDNPFGVARALASVCQMVTSNYTSGIYFIRESTVFDHPYFHYRSVMIDSSRHFLPISAMKRQVAALSVAKMNILHIHESDSQSFPMKTKTEPGSNFVKGAWKTGGVSYFHTLEEMGELASYAKDLGVFLLFELDMPGHAESWRKADPSITCSCGDVINPINPLTLKYIETFLGDIFNVIYKPFGFNPIVHLGGDEVNSWCFGGDQEVSKYMTAHNMDQRAIQHMLHDNVTSIIRKLAREMYPERVTDNNFRFYWQEAFSNGNNFTGGGVVHSWMSSSDIRAAAEKGWYAIRSQAWYLDLNQPGGDQYAFVDSWKDFYGVNPAENVPLENHKYVLGGGGCQWGEKVNDGNIDEQIWPRSIAIGEVLWSYPKDRSITNVLKARLNDLSCKIRTAGTQSGAIIASQPCPGIDDIVGRKKLKEWRDELDNGLGQSNPEKWWKDE